LPVKRLINVDYVNFNTNNLSIYIDTTNINSVYDNTLLIDFEYDTTATGTFGVPVTILPVLEQIPIINLYDINPSFSTSLRNSPPTRYNSLGYNS